jgi:hypothetical protein
MVCRITLSGTTRPVICARSWARRRMVDFLAVTYRIATFRDGMGQE